MRETRKITVADRECLFMPLSYYSTLKHLDASNCPSLNLFSDQSLFSDTLLSLDISSPNETLATPSEISLNFLSALTRLEFLGLSQWTSLSNSLLCKNLPISIRKIHMVRRYCFYLLHLSNMVLFFFSFSVQIWPILRSATFHNWVPSRTSMSLCVRRSPLCSH